MERSRPGLVVAGVRPSGASCRRWCYWTLELRVRIGGTNRLRGGRWCANGKRLMEDVKRKREEEDTDGDDNDDGISPGEKETGCWRALGAPWVPSQATGSGRPVR